MRKEQIIILGILIISSAIVATWYAISSENEFDRKCISAGGVPFYGRIQTLCIASMDVLKVE